MRRQTHLVIGTLAFLAYTYPLYLSLNLSLDTMLMGFFAALFGSVMPDVLEPARHWTHRGLGHSRRARNFAAWAFALTAALGLFHVTIPDLSPCYPASGFFLGYTLHLLADGTTPAGIPG